MSANLIEIDNLSVDFITRTGTVKAIENVSLDIRAGEVVGVIGESGSGKSVLAYTILRLLDHAARIRQGRIMMEGENLVVASERRLAQLRGGEIGMVFQSPRTSLNPIRTIGDQIADALEAHGKVSGKKAREQAVDLLASVRIPDPGRRAAAFPFELSGGMCQRAMIACALACRPKLLIADEPTTGLDVTVQAAVVDLLTSRVADEGASMIFISHDLLLAAECCDRIAVMHAGHIVEVATPRELFSNPRHPYTMSLLNSLPRQDTAIEALKAIPGSLPDLTGEIPFCRFANRCDRRSSGCDAHPIPMVEVSPDHLVRCENPL